MFASTTVLLAALSASAYAAPMLLTRQNPGDNINVVEGSTPVTITNTTGDGTFHVEIDNGDRTGTFGLDFFDKNFALNIACLNDQFIKCERDDQACKDTTRKKCTQGNKIGSVVGQLNTDNASANTKVDNDSAVILNNAVGTPLVSGQANDIGKEFFSVTDDGKGTYTSIIETPIRAIALQIGCQVDQLKCFGGDYKGLGIGTGDCRKDRVTCLDAAGVTGLLVKMNND